MNDSQSVVNAAARLTVGAHRHDHITPLLADLHWLGIPQRILYKLCVLVYRCDKGSAPSYLQNAICPVASAESRRRLRCASSADLIVPATRRTTMGDRAFAVAAPRAYVCLCLSVETDARIHRFWHGNLFSPIIHCRK